MLIALIAALAVQIPQPDEQELFITTSASGLAELAEKVRERNDVECEEISGQHELCVIGGGKQAYVFALPGTYGYPSAYYLGWSLENGAPQLDERSWYVDDRAGAYDFYQRARRSARREVSPTAVAGGQ